MAKKKATQPAQVKVTLVKSTIGSLDKHIKTIEALGLKKVGSSKIFNDNPALRGMLFVVRHLVKVEEVGVQ
ncbi:MAG TPA: 50S ribosomal protein L30 [Clostridia bacterium]